MFIRFLFFYNEWAAASHAYGSSFFLVLGVGGEGAGDCLFPLVFLLTTFSESGVKVGNPEVDILCIYHDMYVFIDKTVIHFLYQSLPLIMREVFLSSNRLPLFLKLNKFLKVICWTSTK